MTFELSAIVLAGGRSRRLGQDKRLLRLASERNQLNETIARVRAVAGDVVVAGAGDQQLGASDARQVDDWVPGRGPLGGIVAGLSVARNDYSLVVACDLPFLDVEVLAAMASLPREYDLLVPRRSDGTLEMLHAIYSRMMFPVAGRHLEQGQLRLSDLARAASDSGLVVRYVDEEELADFKATVESFFNVNTPLDLDLARRLVTRGDVVVSSSQPSQRGPERVAFGSDQCGRHPAETD